MGAVSVEMITVTMPRDLADTLLEHLRYRPGPSPDDDLFPASVIIARALSAHTGRPGSPEQELTVLRSDAARYKGVPVDLPEPVAQYIDELLTERARLRAESDADALRPQVAIPPDPGWVRLDDEYWRKPSRARHDRVEHLDG